MGCAFNLDLIDDFTEDMTHDIVYHDVKKYNVTNIYETRFEKEAVDLFCSQLFLDYQSRRANYRSYLRGNMNARLVYELRKSAILWRFFEGYKDPWFFLAHKDDWGVKEIKEYRKEILREKFIDYEDRDWQYFWVVWYGCRKWKEIVIPVEDIYEDRDPFKLDDYGDPINDLVYRMTRDERLKPKRILW